MNEVFVGGVIVSVEKPEHQAARHDHLVYRLRMTHRTGEGRLKQELYTVNAWNRLAGWAEKNIRPGASVFVKGYLTQHAHGGVTATEITASRFVIRQTTPHAEEGLSKGQPILSGERR